MFFLLSANAVLATPQLVSVHGKLTDTLNNPYAGTKNFVFRIYDAETGGTPLYTEFWNATTQKVSLAFGGYFSVLLGTYTPLTLPFDRQYWLEMNVEGETLSPRTKLGSTPYTYRANITENLAPNANASGNLDMKNSLVQNIGNAGTNFIAGGGLTLAGLLTASSGIAMAGQSLTSALWFNASYLNVSSDGFIGRNLGIGIASPLSRLHISQPGSNTIFNASNGTVNSGLFIGTLSGGQAGASIGTNSNHQFRLFTNGADALTVDTNGNVGIGTTNPIDLIHINSTGDSALRITGVTRARINLGSVTVGWQIEAPGLQGNSPNGTLTITESGSGPRLTIQNSTGYVGIGTTSPTSKLQVNGSVVATSFVTGSGGTASTSGTPVTLFTLPSNGMYLVMVYLAGVEDVINYGAYANILKDGSVQKMIHQVNATLMFITLSGANVQGQQNSGVPQTISYRYIQIQ